jgi:hypothetical protein
MCGCMIDTGYEREFGITDILIVIAMLIALFAFAVWMVHYGKKTEEAATTRKTKGYSCEHIL